MFPGAHAQVYYNEDGEPLGWDYPLEEWDTDPEEYYRDDDFPMGDDDEMDADLADNFDNGREEIVLADETDRPDISQLSDDLASNGFGYLAVEEISTKVAHLHNFTVTEWGHVNRQEVSAKLRELNYRVLDRTTYLVVATV